MLRKNVYTRYAEAFTGDNNFRFQEASLGDSHSGHMFVLWLNESEKRKKLMDLLEVDGIQTSVHYNPIHLEPYYRNEFGYGPGTYLNAELIGASAVSLPTYPGLSITEQDYVIDKVKTAIKNC